MKKYDVIALGELLIDFTDYGISEQTTVFEIKCPRCSMQCACLVEKDMTDRVLSSAKSERTCSEKC